MRRVVGAKVLVALALVLALVSTFASAAASADDAAGGAGGGPAIVEATYRVHYVDVLNTRHDHSDDDRLYTAQHGMARARTPLLALA